MWFYTCHKSMENQSQVFCLQMSNVNQDRAHKFYLWVKKYRFNLVFTCADSENSVREGPEFDISVFAENRPDLAREAIIPKGLNGFSTGASTVFLRKHIVTLPHSLLICTWFMQLWNF